MTSPTDLPIFGPAISDSRCNYLASGACNKCGRTHDGQVRIKMFPIGGVPYEVPVLAIETATEQRLVKLTRTAMRAHAARMLKEQGGLCPLCRKPIDLKVKGEGVIDHDHDTGRIRGLLHRSCNAAEGKISNAAARWGAKSSSYTAIVPYLEALVTYLKAEPSRWIYPMHKTPDEKHDAVLAKRRKAAADLKAKRELARQNRLQAKGTE